MKKYKNLVAIITILLCAFVLNSSNREVAANEKCTKEAAKDYYKMTNEIDDKRKMIIIKAEKGVFNVNLTGTQTGDYKLTAGTPLEIPYDGTKELHVDVVAKLAESDEMCDVTDSQYAEFTMTLRSGVPNELEVNEAYNTTCKAFRDEIAKEGQDAVNFMQSALSYCYQTQVEANFSEKNLKAMISNAKSAWDLKKLTASAPSGDLTITPGFQPVTTTENGKGKTVVGTLKCDPWNRDKNVKNVNRYATTNTVVSNDVCKTDCKEELTVIYDRPISVKAGLCFTYTVEVKSKVTCTATVTAKPPEMPKVCNPYPACNNIANYTDQAGPNDDFDQCVQKCDGGKYSQKCINQCYKKVYSSSKVAKTLSYENKLEAKKLANCTNREGKIEPELVYDAINKNGDGKYYWSGGEIRWQDGSCYWDRYARYYFNSLEKARRTVKNDKSTWNTSYNGFKASNYYPAEGFKRSGSCTEVCHWYGCSQGDYLNASEAVAEYKARLDHYETMIRQCTSAAKCEEKTSYFTMSVLPSNGEDWVKYEATNSPKKGNTQKPAGDTIVNDHSGTCYGKTDPEGNDYRTVINFPGVWIRNKNGQVITKRPPKNEEVFYKHKPNEYCTPLNSKNVNQKWLFWDQLGKEYTDAEKKVIENDLKYNIKASIKDFGRFDWEIKINCFYAIYNGTTPNGENGDDRDDPVCVGASCENCDIGDKNCTPTDITNYRYKAAALDDLFVGDEATTNPQETGRDAGFNWSCAATDLSEENYPVAPTALITDIQEKGDSIYSDEYLDYSITLTPATINKIKQINKEQKNFLNYTGTADKNKDKSLKRSVYRSQLLDELGRGVVTTRYTSAIGCNNQKGGECITANSLTKDACLTTYQSLMKK